jgi:hypothetical protein
LQNISLSGLNDAEDAAKDADADAEAARAAEEWVVELRQEEEELLSLEEASSTTEDSDSEKASSRPSVIANRPAASIKPKNPMKLALKLDLAQLKEVPRPRISDPDSDRDIAPNLRTLRFLPARVRGSPSLALRRARAPPRPCLLSL